MSAVSIFNLDAIEPLIDDIRTTYIDQGRGMHYGWKSNIQKNYDYGHWNNTILKSSKVINYDHAELPYIEAHPLISELWTQIQNVIGDRVLVRAYVNGYTYGTDAYYHKDDTWITSEYGNDAISETILIYMNEEDWDRDWGGETTFIDDNNSFVGAAFPKRNRGVIFHSNIWHSARGLTRMCPVLRSVLVFKTAGPQYNRAYVKWLKERTDDIPHSGTTLFKHLHRTAMIAESGKGSNPDVVKAALYHSIYGTEFFDTNLDVSREEIKDLIGDKAEDLVFDFCTLQSRYETIIDNTEGWDNEKWYNMMLLELSNTLEQEPRYGYNEVREHRMNNLNSKLNELREQLESQ